MSDAFGAVTSWVVFLGGVFLVVQGVWKVVGTGKMTDRTTATMALGVALGVVMAPSIFYQGVDGSARSPFFWTAAASLGIAFVFAILARRNTRQA